MLGSVDLGGAASDTRAAGASSFKFGSTPSQRSRQSLSSDATVPRPGAPVPLGRRFHLGSRVLTIPILRIVAVASATYPRTRPVHADSVGPPDDLEPGDPRPDPRTDHGVRRPQRRDV